MEITNRELPTIPMKLFKRWDTVRYNGSYHIVSHVIVRQNTLLVKLMDIYDPVDTKYVECNTTFVNFNRGNTY